MGRDVLSNKVHSTINVTCPWYNVLEYVMATKQRRFIQSEGRGLIARFYNFLRKEYEFTKASANPTFDLTHLQDIQRRTAEAAGVSMRTVQRILQEEKKLPPNSKITPPLKRRRRNDNKLEVNSFTAHVVRSTIQSFYVVHKYIPTLAKLKTMLHERMGFDGSFSTLRRLLMKLGYKWHKAKNCKVLLERHDIQMSRLAYLKKMLEYRCQGRPIVFTGENYVVTTNLYNTWAKKEHKEESTPAVQKSSTGSVFILVHAGFKDGFIENASLVYKAMSTIGDYHSNVSFDIYYKWLNEKLLPNLPARTVIVLDNASYQNKQADKIPTPFTKKAEMQQWLRDEGIPFEESFLKLELYDLIKQYKDKYVTYKIDDLIKSKGFDVIRLPPTHPELNAIENVWGIVKTYIASKYVDQNMTNMEILINESLDQINSETWRNTCDNVEKIEREYLKYFDIDFKFTIDMKDDSENSESESESAGLSESD